MPLIRTLINAGVVEGLPEGDRKHVILLNQSALVIFVMNVIYLLDRRVLTEPELVAGVTVQTVGCLSAIALNARRRYLAARLSIVGWGLSTIAVMAWLEGRGTERELYLVNVIVGAWMVFPRRERGWAFATSILAVMLTVVLGNAEVPGAGSLHLDPAFVGFLKASTRFALPSFVFLFVFYGQNRMHEAETRLDQERARNEELLLNTLPAPIVTRLKAGETTIADRVDQATVLFADLVNFTALSEQMPPTKLVAMLDDVFSRFDALADARGLEKIKTIGDAYMVAGGVPAARDDHADQVAGMALDMLRTLDDLGDAYRALALRIGVHTGPVVAGVIGRRKLVYDLWGDTVNTASRMESHGVAGKIQVSAETKDALGDRFTFEARGTVPIKGKGELATWFLVDDARKMPR